MEPREGLKLPHRHGTKSADKEATLQVPVALTAALARATQMAGMLAIGHVFPHHNPVAEEEPLAGLVAWDSLWFQAIARYGYSVPQTVAFLPGMPLLFRHVPQCVLVLAWPVFAGLTAMLQQDVMSKIGWRTEHATSLSTALLSSFTPASAHFSALYSETPFALLSTLCVWCSLHIEDSVHPTRWISLSALLSVAASLFRSNGLLLFGYVACGVLRMKGTKLAMWLRWIVVALLGLCVLSPVHFHLLAACRRLGIDTNWWELLPGYGQVQERFWDVGFMRYYKPKNTPRFLLTLPSLAAWTAGLWRLLCGTCRGRGALSTEMVLKPFLLPWTVIVSVHALVQMLVCLTCANVEILPRLLWASSPVIVSELVPKWGALVLMGQGVLGQWLFALHYAYT